MKDNAPILTAISIFDGPDSTKRIRLDFSNDRHHLSEVISGDRESVARALYKLSFQIQQDKKLNSNG